MQLDALYTELADAEEASSNSPWQQPVIAADEGRTVTEEPEEVTLNE